MSEGPDDGETESFRVADEKIGNLLKRLDERGLCPDCTARALVMHAVGFAECMLGSAKAIELFEGIIADMREDSIPAPDPFPSTTH
jgi:hypothetical protein